jgi:hypothetical protein
VTIKSFGYWLLPLALLIGLGLRVPGWYTQDIKASWKTFEPDEGQHVHAASVRFNELYDGDEVVQLSGDPWNVRGFGYLMGNTYFAWHRISGQLPEYENFILHGRRLSTLFALLLILSVWYIGRVSALPPPWAGLAALLVASCDVNATYSHYCLPASGYIFWCYLAILGALRLAHGHTSVGNLFLLALGTAGALAFKFDVLPLIWGGLLLLYLAFTDRSLRWWFIPLGIGFILIFTWLFWYGWSWESIQSTFKALRELNRDGVPVDNHYRDNLIVYPMGVLAGIGLPAFGLAIWGLVRLLLRRNDERSGTAPNFTEGLGEAAGAKKRINIKVEKVDRRILLVYLFGWLLSEFLVRWSVDTAFIRRVNVFMPAVCLLAAYALYHWRPRLWVPIGLVVYTLAFGIVGQWNHWYDTRYDMREFVNTEIPKDAKIAVSGYVQHQGLRKTRFFMSIDWDYAILHETYYSRYWKSMTTPFGMPVCCDEVYNCQIEEQCKEMQALLLGTSDDARMIRAFIPFDIFPERLFYRSLWGNYETFLGTTLVYEKIRD